MMVKINIIILNLHLAAYSIAYNASYWQNIKMVISCNNDFAQKKFDTCINEK